jgi:hypothetical protein
MVLSACATRVDKLETLAVLKSTAHNQITSDRVMLEALKHFSGKELQVKSAGVTRAVILTLARKLRGVRRRLKSHCSN